jgi:hypothetical protein
MMTAEFGVQDLTAWRPPRSKWYAVLVNWARVDEEECRGELIAKFTRKGDAYLFAQDVAKRPSYMHSVTVR